jgi:hypothetical protein
MEWIVKLASWNDVLCGRAPRFLDARGSSGARFERREDAHGFATELDANIAANRWRDASVMPKPTDARGFPLWPDRGADPTR